MLQEFYFRSLILFATHQVPESDEGAVRICEEAYDDVAVQNGHGRLVAVQDALLYRSSCEEKK